VWGPVVTVWKGEERISSNLGMGVGSCSIGVEGGREN
jgi:hypothetical protein